MKLTKLDIARLIDLSAVQAQDSDDYIRSLVKCARKYHVIAVITLPARITFTQEILGVDSGVLLGGTAGFPAGGQTTAVKVFEAREQIRMGCAEMDMVINIGKLVSGRYSDVLHDIKAVVEACKGHPVKVILECHYLNEKQIRQGCDACLAGGAAWVKTSTGWAKSGATFENIRLIRSHVGDSIGIKAAGGVRDLETVLGMYRRGVRRFGVGLKSGIKILEQAEALPGGFVDVEPLD